jgi:hypothetical protein
MLVFGRPVLHSATIKQDMHKINMNILLATAIIQDIPVLTLAPATTQPCPAVFFIPGFRGNKEDGLRLGYRLARRGCFVISLDPWQHGERYARRLDHADEPELGGLYPRETGLDTFILFYRVIHQCLLDVQTLLEHYAADARVNVERCGVTGVSMGGYASFLIFASLPQMQAAVPMLGVPGFTRRWLDLLDECAFSNLEWAATLQRVQAQTRRHTEFAQQIDPVERLGQAAPRALYMMNCDFDTDQPKHYAVECYRALLPHYAAHPDKLKLSIYPAAHVVTPDMERDAADWLCRHLQDERRNDPEV